MYEHPYEIGTDKLSSKGEYNSVNVAMIIDINAKYRLISIAKRIIVKDDMKKARDPSSVLFLILIVPYILPNKAATVSDITIINNEIPIWVDNLFKYFNTCIRKKVAKSAKRGVSILDKGLIWVIKVSYGI